MLDGFECEGNIGIISGRPLRINLSSCSQEITTNRPRLIIETEDGIIQRDLRSQDLGVGVGAGTGGGGTPSLSPFFNDCTLQDDKTGCEVHYVQTTVNGIDVVHDTILGLYWEQSPTTTQMNWASAQTHCSNIGSGWRLPTLVEMELSLVDTGRSSAPFIIGGSGGGNLFDNIQSGVYWTDTRRSSSFAFDVRFNVGLSNTNLVTNSHRVLCVKEAPDFNEIWGATQKFEPIFGGTGQERVASQFTPDASQCGGAGTMYDTITNLCWERNPSTGIFTHAQAISRCNSLSTAGGGWRLPQKAELMTLLFHSGDGETASRLNSIGFSGIQNSFYWPNTLRSSSFAFRVSFNLGRSDSESVTLSFHVLCVKTAP